MDDERLVAEGLFRSGCVRVLVATSTLSAGVNLNVDAVVLDSIRRCNQYYSRTEYKQMIGRTGRMGQEKKGLVFTLLDACDVPSFQRLALETDCEISQVRDEAFVASETRGYLRSSDYWRKAVVEMVACGIETSVMGVLRVLTSQSYYGHLKREGVCVERWVGVGVRCGPPEEYVVVVSTELTSQIQPLWEIVEALRFLLKFHFVMMVMPVEEEVANVMKEGVAEKKVLLELTELGEAVFRSGMNVSDVQQLAASLSRLNENVDISNNFQILFHLTPFSLDVHVDISSVLQYTECHLSEAELHYINRDIIPLGMLYSLRNGRSIDVRGIRHSSRIVSQRRPALFASTFCCLLGCSRPHSVQQPKPDATAVWIDEGHVTGHPDGVQSVLPHEPESVEVLAL